MSTGVEGKGDDEINFFTSLRKRKLDMQPGVGLSRGLSDRGEQDLVACMYVCILRGRHGADVGARADGGVGGDGMETQGLTDSKTGRLDPITEEASQALRQSQKQRSCLLHVGMPPGPFFGAGAKSGFGTQRLRDDGDCLVGSTAMAKLRV